MTDASFSPDMARKLYRDVCKADVAKVAEEQAQRDHRTYYGASQLGKKCDREMFLSFRKAAEPLTTEGLTDAEMEFLGARMRLFDRGHMEEDRFIQRITPMFDEVYPVDPETGKQWEIVNCEGLFKGHMDGKALNLRIGDTTLQGLWLLEFKTHGTKSFDKLAGAKRADGTRPWDKRLKDVKPDHYAQVQVYMWHDPEIEGCLYLAVCKDTDEWYVELIERDPALAQSEMQRVANTVWARKVPPRMEYASRVKNFYCNHFCDFNDVCFGLKEPPRTCRTCDAFRIDGEHYICGAENGSLDKNDLSPCKSWRKIAL